MKETVTMTKEEFQKTLKDIATKMVKATYEVVDRRSPLMELNDKLTLGVFIGSASKIIFDEMTPEEVFTLSNEEEIANDKVQDK